MILTQGLGDKLFSSKLAQTRPSISALLPNSGNVVSIAVQHDFEDGLTEKYLHKHSLSEKHTKLFKEDKIVQQDELS